MKSFQGKLDLITFVLKFSLWLLLLLGFIFGVFESQTLGLKVMGYGVAAWAGLNLFVFILEFLWVLFKSVALIVHGVKKENEAEQKSREQVKDEEALAERGSGSDVKA